MIPSISVLSWRTFSFARQTVVVRAAIFVVLVMSLFYGWFQALPRETRVLMLSESVTASCKPNETLYTDEASCATRHDRAPIPNIAHFVYILSDPDNGTFPFKFSHLISVYGAWRRWQPDVLYLHTNVAASSSAVLQARAGEQGKWAQRLFNMPGLVINTISAPTHTNRGQELKHMEHRSDFVRVKVVHDFGGVYMDMDVHALRDMRPLREAGYKAVAGRQGGGLLNSGTFLAAKGSKATRMWTERMHEVYDGRWTTHSNEALTTLGEDLKMYPCEMLMLDQAAFAPIGWKWFDSERLFGEHYTATSLDQLKKGAGPVEGRPDGSDNAAGLFESKLPWAHDWSCTFLLHAFSRQKPKLSTKDHDISPRYIAERRSLYARAVYPILRDMYINGVIDQSDLEIESE
ncbi:glycosyl transferase [Akanthomyces lecanii RCEF 1005]|uniref:Glycosyl transferase n=1 Tax=Akanthomyces lecanii RCEF 1005 TaxID=1081108 RepID=A0A168IL79_CORDF|nr:glycosyl transferase [Akanthomyces lecanii RCEF 1005]